MNLSPKKIFASIFGDSQRDAKVKRYREMVKASYYSAASDSPSMDFSFANNIGFREALSADLNTLRNRVRYELRQNGPAKGLCRVYANACVSTGPSLSIDSDNPEWADEVEFEWAEWARNCGYLRGESLAELLHCGVRQFFSAGEYFSVNKFDAYASTPIQLRLMQIKADRIVSPDFGANSVNIFDGVEFDANGKPVAYHVRDKAGSYRRESARNIRHVFYQEEPEQVRGEPWLSSGLSDLHKRRRYDEARVAAAIVATKFAVFITQNDPSIALSAEELLPEGVIDLNDGAATVLPPHCGVQSFSGSQPVAGADQFRREMIANAGAAVGMSSGAANQDSSNSNFASARYDDVGVGLEHNVVRDIIANRDLSPLFATWYAEASALREFPSYDGWYRLVWRWPCANRHTDPQKAATSDAKRIESGAESFSQIWSEHGASKEQKRTEILEDVEWCRKHGLNHPLIAQPVQTPNVDRNQDMNQDENDSEGQ